ncbi:MAG: HAD hydrolase-like protein [Eubacteriales bacterium]|nr:HAD hydrolase-like protein [Eubacteriales bacterium]
MKDRPYLICIDSDGCVFDNMELKHKECFCPAVINVWNLQNISRYAREVWDYVNLYSHLRGENRFLGIVDTLELLEQRPEVLARGYRKPDLSALKRFVADSPSLSASALQDFIVHAGETEDLRTALRWSEEVNENVRRIVRNVAPFPAARAALQALHAQAKIVIVSQAQAETLRHEWQELLAYVDELNGQEVGSKADCIRKAREAGFDAAHTLMIGDAPGDAVAAKQAGALFYPIIPGQEDESWEQLPQIASKFFANKYDGTLADSLKTHFDSKLRDVPPWKTI